jgi:cytochrome P450
MAIHDDPSAASSSAEASVAPPGAVPRCPVVNGVPYDPMREDQILDPHPWLSAARREAPVFYMPEYDEWCVTRHADILDVLRDTKTFSSRRVVAPRHLPRLEERLPNGHPMHRGLVNTDPPEHVRLRKLAQKAFTPKMVDSYEPAVRSLAASLIVRFADHRRVNLIGEFTRHFTGGTITIVVGAPPEKANDFLVWSDNNLTTLVDAPPLSAELERQMIDNLVSFNDWLLDFIEERRLRPRNDLTSLLVQARGDDGEQSLATFEVVSILTNVITAGVDTTSSLIGLFVHYLLSDRERWERLAQDRSAIPRAVEEFMRYGSPVHSIRRDVMADTEIGGVPIPSGSTLALSFASAQRDPSVFADADIFDIERADRDRSFAWGRWRHFCLGAPLARMEAKVAVEEMLDRLPNIRLADGAGPQVLQNRAGAFLTGLDLVW